MRKTFLTGNRLLINVSPMKKVWGVGWERVGGKSVRLHSGAPPADKLGPIAFGKHNYVGDENSQLVSHKTSC